MTNTDMHYATIVARADDDAPMPTIVEVAGLAADERGLWVVSRDGDEPGVWRGGPITYRHGRDGTIRNLLGRKLPFPGLHPYVHGTSEREDFSLTVPGCPRPGALVLSNAAIIGGWGKLGDLRGTPMTFVADVFPWAFCLDPDVLAEIGPPPVDELSDEPRRQIRRLDPILHAARHAAFLLGVQGPDGGWLVEPDLHAAAALDDWWRYWLGSVQKALAGWWGGGQGAGFSFTGPAPGQRSVPQQPAIGLRCPTCGKPAGS